MTYLLKLGFLAFLLCSCMQLYKRKTVITEIENKKVISIGMTGDYAPFSEWREGQFYGVDVELAQKLAQSLGVRVRFVQTSWPTLLADLKDKKFHIAMSGITVKSERKKVGFFSKGYVEIGKLGISRCADAYKFGNLKDIDKKSVRVAINKGGTNETFARKHIKEAQIIVFPNNSKIFGHIINNKADVMLTDSIEVFYQSKKHKGKLCPTMKEPVTKKEIAFLMQKDNSLKEYVDKWLNKMELSGEKEKIFKKYLK